MRERRKLSPKWQAALDEARKDKRPAKLTEKDAREIDALIDRYLEVRHDPA